MKYEYHEERRKKEAAEREKEEAVKHAERILQENNKLRKTLDDGEAVLVEQVKGKASAMIEAAKKEYKEAYEAGDPDKITEAQIKLNQAQNEAFKVQDYKPKQRAQEPESKQVYTPAPAQKHEPTKEDKAWMAENDWFQKEGEEAMTGFALGVHQSLIKKGINPKIDPESYYGEIDKRMRATFPDYFNKNVVETEEVTAPPRQAGSVVAPPTRSAKKPRKVQLTSTQVNLARRLGLSNEQYAAQLLKEASNLGQADMTNVSSKFREGWEPVKAEDHPELKVLTDVDSKFKGNVEVGGLLLCKNSTENMDARREHYKEKNDQQIASVDNNYLRESDSRMPVLRPEKVTRTS